MSLPGFFVVGTDTGVGKTHVAAALARTLIAEGRRVGVLKPVATGAERVGGQLRSDDAERLIAAVGGGVAVDRVVPFVFGAPVAPPVAARREGLTLTRDAVERSVDALLAWWEGPGGADLMVVEGVGGLLCPLSETSTVADLCIHLDLPLLIVARRGLGTINHTLLTVEAARARALRIAGVVVNSPSAETGDLAEATNVREIAGRLPADVPLLAVVAHNSRAQSDGIVSLSARTGVWSGRAAPPRHPAAQVG